MAKIRAGDFAPGSRLPPENELAAQLGVSRTSIRTALTILEAKRLIVRRQGDGTYLNKRVMEINTRLGEEWDFKYMIEDSGRTPRIETIELCIRPAVPDEANALEISPEAPVLAIRRLFLANDQPAIYSTNLIPVSLLKVPEPYQVERPIRDILQEYCSEEIYYSLHDISATLPDPESIRILNLREDQPLVRFSDIFFNKNDQALAYGRNYFYDQALRLRVTRTWG